MAVYELTRKAENEIERIYEYSEKVQVSIIVQSTIAFSLSLAVD
jgi:plasmid stabilization system protein ParE